MLYYKTVLFFFVLFLENVSPSTSCPFKIQITSGAFGSLSTMAAGTHLHWSCALCKWLYYMLGDQNDLHYIRMKNCYKIVVTASWVKQSTSFKEPTGIS